MASAWTPTVCSPGCAPAAAVTVALAGALDVAVAAPRAPVEVSASAAV